MKKNFLLYSLNIIFIFPMVIGMLLGQQIVVGSAQSDQDWAAPVNISNSGSASDPLLVVDGGGGLHVLWVDKFDGYRYSTSTDGIVWTSSKIVDFPFSPGDFPPVFLVDARGIIHIFWLTEDNVFRYGQSLPANLGAPSAWGKLLTLDTSVYAFDVSIDPETGLHVDYIVNPEDGDEPAGVYYRKSQNGSAWSAAELLYQSLYFRSLSTVDAHVSIESSNGNLFAVWDDRSLKRIFMARSTDAGVNWGPATQIIGPEASQGFKTPINIEVREFNNSILLMWQVGDPGIRCTQFSQWSEDGGESWTEPVKMFDEFIVCPDKSEFLFVNDNYVMALFSIQGELSLIAWNGAEWSVPETQSGLSIMSNSTTYDLIVFQCQQVSSYGDKLFVVGCDQGSSGDIWFTSRLLDPVSILFPLPSDWGGTQDVTVVSQQISSMSSVADQDDNIHALWAQSAASESEPYEPNIQYARWNGEGWSNPIPVITRLNGSPNGLDVTIDNQHRLLLTWVNEDSGDLMFSWANSGRANVPSEWNPPVVLPSPSGLNASPDILVDVSNQIVIAYAVNVNEERGIYLVYSNDLGESWSSPLKVFDAVAAGWEAVDKPKLALTGDGRLHMLFTRYSVMSLKNSNGLYYVQSSNGGSSWSDPDVVSDQAVLAGTIIGDNTQMLHRLWQTKEKSATVMYHQVSQDGGLTWAPVAKVSTVEGDVSFPALSITGAGNLHFMQILTTGVPLFQEWTWTGERWSNLNNKELNLKDQDIPVSISSAITSDGTLGILILIEREDLINGHRSQLMSIDRKLETSDNAQLISTSIITAAEPVSEVGELPDLQPSATALSPLVNLETPSSGNKNAIGVVLIVVVVIGFLLFILPARKRRSDSDINRH